MSAARAEPFGLALGELRARLRQGEVRPDQRLAATEIAQALGLSATPVREALARLAGEGLLEDRRGQGYYLRRLGGADLADLHRLHLAHLAVALDRCALAGGPPGPDDRRGPADTVETLFAGWVAAAGSWALSQSHARLQVLLGPARRAEAWLFPDLATEAEALAAARPDARRRLVRAYHARRIRRAGDIAEALERSRARSAL
jgi:DNA-binding GntR family transcriptional regulator